MFDPDALLARLDLSSGRLGNQPLTSRRLKDLGAVFASPGAYARALAQNDPVVYSVSSVERFNGPGDLHFGLGVLMSGRIGDEYFQTKGHYHAWRESAEVYVGLSGTGLMLLEHEHSGSSRLIELAAGTVVYVPGSTAHRTVNTGAEPLAYVGIYPAGAGHDYQSLERSNFRHVVVEREGQPTLVERRNYQPSA